MEESKEEMYERILSVAEEIGDAKEKTLGDIAKRYQKAKAEGNETLRFMVSSDFVSVVKDLMAIRELMLSIIDCLDWGEDDEPDGD